METGKEMRTIFVSEIPMLENFDIVRLIDDHTKEFKGYFLNKKYQKNIKELAKKEAVIQAEDKR